MNIYLAIITTFLVATQIIRVCQNHIQLRRQHILFKKQLGQLADCEPTKEDFENQRKAYRLIVKHFEEKKMPPLIQETRHEVKEIKVAVEMDELRASHDIGALDAELNKKIGEAVRHYATTKKTNDPLNYTVKAEALVDVVDKRC